MASFSWRHNIQCRCIRKLKTQIHYPLSTSTHERRTSWEHSGYNVREEEFRATAFQSRFGSLSWRSDCWCYLQGLKNVARKTARVNPDLIDVDLVRGLFSSFCFMIDCWKFSHENWWFLKKKFFFTAGMSVCLSICLFVCEQAHRMWNPIIWLILHKIQLNSLDCTELRVAVRLNTLIYAKSRL